MLEKKQIRDKLSICFPQSKMKERPVERLIKPGRKGRSFRELLGG